MRALHRFGDSIFNKCAWFKFPRDTMVKNQIKLEFHTVLYSNLFLGIYFKVSKLIDCDVSFEVTLSHMLVLVDLK